MRPVSFCVLFFQYREIYKAFHETNEDSAKKCCYHANVIGYALSRGEGKAVMKKINEVCKQTGLSKRTLQYYDDEGLLLVHRDIYNYRMFDEKALERIWEILVYKEMGFELSEIKHLSTFSTEQKRGCLECQKEVVKEQITDLRVITGFVSLVLDHGMPSVPKEDEGLTYVDGIRELREKIRLKATR